MRRACRRRIGQAMGTPRTFVGSKDSITDHAKPVHRPRKTRPPTTQNPSNQNAPSPVYSHQDNESGYTPPENPVHGYVNWFQSPIITLRDEYFCFECVLYHGRYEKAQFRFSDEAWASIEPHVPGNRPVARRVEDRRVILGILHVLKVGFGRCDCPAEQGPSSTSLQSVQSLVAAWL